MINSIARVGAGNVVHAAVSKRNILYERFLSIRFVVRLRNNTVFVADSGQVNSIVEYAFKTYSE